MIPVCQSTSKGSVPDGQYLLVTDPNTTLSKTIFSGIRTNFTNNDPVSKRSPAEAKAGSVTLLNYDNGDPALLYWQYGNGYVIEWTPVSNSRYLSTTEADLINQRLITFLANEKLPKTTVTTPVATLSNTGSVSVYSSPLGASVLIDGRYYGTTPANLTDIQPGNHIIRLTLSGYYDYEGTNLCTRRSDNSCIRDASTIKPGHFIKYSYTRSNTDYCCSTR